MGQYWIPVNLDKKEFIDPHKPGTGLKLREHIANHPGTGAALLILCAAMPEERGGGDLDLDQNWHGPERTMQEYPASPGPMPTQYPEIAKAVIGRWAGNRIALVGDYAEDSDLPEEFKASKIYNECREDGGEYTDITPCVAAVIGHELGGAYIGQGWMKFQEGAKAPLPNKLP